MINTAFAMKNLVPRVLVVDCDLKDQHFVQLLKFSEKKFGLGEFLANQAPLEECLYRDLERNLDIIASGKPINASQATSRNLQALLGEVRDMYDAIFLHSDPILTSDLTEYLSEHSDVTVLISQGDKTLYRDLYRAASFFFRLEITALAPLLNWGGRKDKDVITIQLEKLQKNFYRFAEKRRKKAGTDIKKEKLS
jgi:MinD-like ATPase involved in chromosome partitioning or flagellar assembly